MNLFIIFKVQKRIRKDNLIIKITCQSLHTSMCVCVSVCVCVYDVHSHTHSHSFTLFD